MTTEDRLKLAEQVRKACIEAAQQGYEDASMAGLCGEGALEVAIGAMQELELGKLVAGSDNPASAP